MPKSSRSRAAVGRRNKQAGKEFERRIATDLRQILDPRDLTRAIKEASDRLKGNPGTEQRAEATRTIKSLQKRSCVRRGEQGRGAHEPDIVTPTPWWIEVSRRSAVSPLGKLAQAERDVFSAVEVGELRWTRPVALWRKTGSHEIIAALSFAHLIEACTDQWIDALPEWTSDLPVMLEYKRFLDLVEHEHG